MRLVIISDTHGQHEDLVLPDGDVLIHCGDVCDYSNEAAVLRFIDWFDKQKHGTKIFIGGNHDARLHYKSQAIKDRLDDLVLAGHDTVYLEDDWIEINKVKFYGSPWTPTFFNWYFMKDRGEEINKVWGQIPSDIDVLITHGPPKGIIDKNYRRESCGCEDLLNRVKEIKPRKVHCFGHIHQHKNATKQCIIEGQDTVFINASSVDEEYKLINPPIVIDI